jgi:competence protein ComEC
VADWRYGDRITVKGRLKTIVAEQSSYDRYLVQHGITGMIKWGSVTLISQGNGNPLIAAVYGVQDACQAAVSLWLSRDEAGLLLGVVLGLQQPLSPQFTDQLGRTSTTHIIVASGYNAAIIVSVVMGLAGRLRRRAVVSLVLIVLVAYVALSGFNPSMIRAAIMAAAALTAYQWGRQRLALHLLYCTAILMLLINPLWIFDTSFQLSFAATTGIILFEQIIRAKIPNIPDSIKEIISTTLSAQILTIPIISSTFGTVAVLGLLANLLVLWAIPWVMGIGALAIPATLVVPVVGHWLLWASEPLLWYIKQCIGLIASIPFASVAVQFPLWACLLYYAAAVYAWRRGARYAMAT